MGAIAHIVPPKYVLVPIYFLKLYIALGEFQSIPDCRTICEHSMFLDNFCNFFISELNATSDPSLANGAYTCTCTVTKK